MKRSGKLSLFIIIIYFLIYGVIRFSDIETIPLFVAAFVLSIIGTVLGFLSKNLLITVIHLGILLISFTLLFALAAAYGRTFYS